MSDLVTNVTVENNTKTATSSESVWIFPATMVAWILIVAIASWRYHGTPIRPKSAPEDQFSARRALVILEDLVGDGITHPSGSEQNAVVRQRVIDHLKKYGYDVAQQKRTAVTRSGEKIPLVNLFTRYHGKNHGTPSQRLIAVVSHYDSRAPAPGAGDDGAGVAASLEVARMLKQMPQLNHDILFLITDGEELGLLGAREFVDKKKLLTSQIDVVINLEARGTAGPSLMFETHPDNSVSVQQFSAASPKPFCGSLFYEIYKKLPNDTDFTVFKQEDIPGFNFAFIGDVENYHAESDTIQNLDLNSLQHHGDNLLSLLLELDKADQFQPGPNETKFRVYFDVMGWFVIDWPVHWSSGLWILGLIGCVAVYWCIRPEKLAPESTDSNVPAWVVWFNSNRWIRSAFWILVMIGASLMAAFAMHAGLLSGEAIQRGWVNDAVAVELGYWSVAICAIYVCVWLAEQSGLENHIWLVVIVLWSILGLLVTLNIAGACYLFIMPLLTTALLSIVPAFIFKRSFQTWVFFIFAVSVGFFWLPMERMFYDAVGFRINLLLVVRIALVTTAIFPIAFATHEKWVPRIAISFAFLGFGASILCVVWT